MRLYKLLSPVIAAGLTLSLSAGLVLAESAAKNDGAKATAVQSQGGLLPGETRDQKRERLVKGIEAQVGTLTADQKQHILAVLAAAGDEMAAARANSSLSAEEQAAVVRNVHADVFNRIRPALTAAQRAKLGDGHSGRSGGFGMGAERADGTPEERRARAFKRYEEALPDLTAAQKEQIGAVLDTASKEIKALYDNATLDEDEQRAAIRKAHDATGEKVDAILTAPQRVTWQKARAERRRLAGQQDERAGGLLPGETREQKRARLLKSYEAILTDLTVEQKTRILAAMEAAGDEMRAADGDVSLNAEQKQAVIGRAHSGVGAKVEAILTDAQRVKWRKARDTQPARVRATEADKNGAVKSKPAQ